MIRRRCAACQMHLGWKEGYNQDGSAAETHGYCRDCELVILVKEDLATPGERAEIKTRLLARRVLDLYWRGRPFHAALAEAREQTAGRPLL